MFRITRDPSSGSSVQCLAKITVIFSIASVDMDVVGVMAAYLPVVRVCTAQCRECVCVLHSVERQRVCVLHSVERCVCVLHSVERCVCVLHSVERQRVCVLHSVERCVCVLHSVERQRVCVYCTV